MIKPLNNYVALKPIEEEKVTASGIYLGSSQSNKQPMGKVVAIKATYYMDGYGEVMSCGKVNVGDVVYYKNGIEIKEGNETYIMVQETDLIAVVDRGEE